MKKFILSLTLLYFINLFPSFGQTGVNYRQPCNTDFSFPNNPCIVPWSQVKWDTICTDNFQYATPCTPPQGSVCCFYIQYVDRFIKCYDNPIDYYDVQILMISSIENCKACYDQTKDSIIKEFKFRRYQAVGPMLAQARLDSGMMPPFCFAHHHQTSRGACFSLDSLTYELDTCSNIYCCANFDRVCYDIDGNIIQTLTSDQGKNLFYNGVPLTCDNSPINCPGGTMECNLNLFVPRYEGPCEILLPCPFGQQIVDSLTVQFDNINCPLCNVKIKYRYSEAECEPGYKDYFLDSCILDSLCAYCPGLTEIDIYKLAIQSILKYGNHGVPEKGECDSTYRIATASCWTKPGGSFTSLDPCINSGCCWSRYLVCTDNSTPPQTTYTRIDNNYDSLDCPLATRPCQYVCDIDPSPKISIKSEKYESIFSKDVTTIRPNPTTGIVELLLLNHEKGKLGIQFYDRIGNQVKQFEFDLTGEYSSINLDLSTLANGFYFYIVSVNNKKLDRKSLILIK